MLKTQPKLTDLYQLIEKVPRYPITSGQLVDLASANNANSSVIGFYRSFKDVTFYDEDDLAGTSEQLQFMEKEEIKQPPDSYLTSQED